MLRCFADYASGRARTAKGVNDRAGRREFCDHPANLQDSCIVSTMRISQWPKNSNSGMFAANMALHEADDTEVQGRLRLLRLAMGHSQVVMAGLLGSGMTAQKWNNYERGRDRIPVDMAIRLCTVTGANLDYIYRGIMGSLPSDLIQKLQEVRLKEAEQPPKKASARS